MIDPAQLSVAVGAVKLSTLHSAVTSSKSATSARGGVKIGYSENGKNYPVELSSEKMYVNVPWTDNNTTYSVGDGGLTQINFTSAFRDKLNSVAMNANNYSLSSLHTLNSSAATIR